MTNKTSAFGGTIISDQPNPQSFGNNAWTPSSKNAGTPSSNNKSSFRQAVEQKNKELARANDSFFNKVISEVEQDSDKSIKLRQIQSEAGPPYTN